MFTSYTPQRMVASFKTLQYGSPLLHVWWLQLEFSEGSGLQLLITRCVTFCTSAKTLEPISAEEACRYSNRSPNTKTAPEGHPVVLAGTLAQVSPGSQPRGDM